MRKIITGFFVVFVALSMNSITFATSEGILPSPESGNATSDVGKRIQNGNVHLSDIPIIVIHLINICTKLAGTIAVIFLLYAGFQMIISGVSEDRQAAKNTIKYALAGLIVSFLAWVLVNLVQVQLTS